jgi:alkylglycerol monooxygenase
MRSPDHRVETTAYYTFGIPAYGLMLALEAWSAHHHGRLQLTYAKSMGNIMSGLGAITVGLFLGTLVYLLYDWAYRNFALVHWPAGSVWPFVVGIFLADLAHYWHHRLEHRVAAFWAVHGVHHQAEEMNFTVSLRHAWFSDTYSFPFYALLPVLGIPTGQFFLATSIMSFHAFLTHSREYNFPSFGILVTPRTHILHHAINERYIDKNFGAMFSIWDRIFGTHVELDPDDAPVYGTFRGYDSHDGAMVQFTLWRELIAVARSVQGWRAKVRVFLSRPGWPGLDVMAPRVVSPPDSKTMSWSLRGHVITQFLVVLCFAVHLFVFRDQQSWAYRVVAAGFVFMTLFALGGLLDARRRSVGFELGRLLVGLSLGCALFVSHARGLGLGALDEGRLAILLAIGSVVGLVWLLGASRSEHLLRARV